MNNSKDKKKNKTDLSIIIPAAGIGRRMKSHGAKPLIQLLPTETVIERQIKIFNKVFPKAEIIVVVGFQADKLIKHLPKTIKVVENEFYEETSVVRSITMGLRVATHDNILIIYGDLIFNSDQLNHFVSNGSAVIVDSNNQMNNETIGVTVVEGFVTRFSYGLRTKWAHMLFLNGNELEIFRTLSGNKLKRKSNTFEILNTIIERWGKISAVEPKNLKVIEIDTIKDIEIARTIM